jgi:hypothetical protein
MGLVPRKEIVNMSSELVPATSADPVALGKVLAQSGYFSDAKQAAQAAVKVMAGEEVGLGPIASMTNIHIVQGKVTIGANMIAALIRRHPDYDYEVTEHTDKVCSIKFIYKGKPAGVSTFSMEDAATAGLTKNPTWKAHPRNMLFARAISNGAKWYAPDVSAGAPIYTPDELGAEVDGETLEVVRVPEPVAAEPEPAQTAMTQDEVVTRDLAEIETAQEFDPAAVTEMLKAEFGATVVKKAYTAAGIKKYADLTPDKADEISDQLRMTAVAA